MSLTVAEHREHLATHFQGCRARLSSSAGPNVLLALRVHLQRHEVRLLAGGASESAVLAETATRDEEQGPSTMVGAEILADRSQADVALTAEPVTAAEKEALRMKRLRLAGLTLNFIDRSQLLLLNCCNLLTSCLRSAFQQYSGEGAGPGRDSRDGSAKRTGERGIKRLSPIDESGE